MARFLKKIYFFICVLLKTAVSCFCVIVFSKSKLLRFTGKGTIAKEHNAVSILANGPSVKEIMSNHPELLNDTDLLAMNFFANSEEFWKFKPKYYIILDPAFFDDNHLVKTEINQKSLLPTKKMMCDNLSKVDWNMIFFMPYTKAAERTMSKYINNEHISLVWYNTTRILGFDSFQNTMYKRCLGIPSSRNVAIAALMMMINMGYKKIYLYGVEFSWTKNMDVDPVNGKMFFNDRHFYSNSEVRYFDKGGYRWWLESISEMLYAMDQMSKYADYRKVDVVNRTVGSFIDSFIYENPIIHN